MRINKFVAQATGMSRRAADAAVSEGRVLLNGAIATTGATVAANDKVLLDGKPLTAAPVMTILFHKPVGYVVSRDGQGSATIYDVLPPALHSLKPVGRLDKDSSGLLLLTNNGDLANQLTHPRYVKQKEYHVTLDAPLQPLHHQMIADRGITLDDGLSKLGLERIDDQGKRWIVRMSEGRNRQIRRTFAALGYTVTALHRTHFGIYQLGDIEPGEHQQAPTP